MASFAEITHEMMAALEGEIAALKKRSSSQGVTLFRGRRQGKAAGRFLYSFDVSSDFRAPPDTPGQLQVGKARYEAVVVSTQEFEIVLSVDEDQEERAQRLIHVITLLLAGDAA